MHEMKNVIDTKCEAIPEVQKHLDLLVQSIKRDLDVSRSDKSVAIIGNNEMQEARLLPALKAGIVFSWILPFYILAFMAGEAPFSGVQGWDLFWSIVQSVLLTAMAPLMFFGGAVMILSESPAASMIPKNYYPITIGIFIVSFAIAYILSNRDTFARNRAAAASQKERKKNAQNAQAVLASLLVSMSELSECLSLRAKSSLRLPGA
jgi:hypothetical protein